MPDESTIPCANQSLPFWGGSVCPVDELTIARILYVDGSAQPPRRLDFPLTSRILHASDSVSRAQCRRELRVGTGHVGHQENQAMRGFFGARDQLLRPFSRGRARECLLGDPRGDAPQVLNQRLPDHDRNGPQLAKRQWSP